MKKLILIFAITALTFSGADAQSFLNKIKNKAIESTQKAVEKKVEEKVDEKIDEAATKVVDKAAEKAEEAIVNAANTINEASQSAADAIDSINYQTAQYTQSSSTTAVQGSTSYNSPNNANLVFDDWDMEEEDYASGNVNSAPAGNSVTAPAAATDNAAPAAAPQNDRAAVKYNKFDFVAGDKIIFEDNQVGETLGEFPSQWDLIEGMSEIANVGGSDVIALQNSVVIAPYMKDLRNNLGEVFTVEFDYYQFLEKEGEDYGAIVLSFFPKDEDYYAVNTFELSFPVFYNEYTYHNTSYDASTTCYSYVWNTSNGDRRDGTNKSLDVNANNWVHISISFNKRALKVYVNETRIVNIPNMVNNCGWMSIKYGWADDKYPAYIRNIRIAQGAVPLYDRMMSDGKFITYGITFDVGKSSIKPESMGEINRIVALMNEKPELKFSVEGHTDATGSASGNQTLSEARSKAIVDMLVSLGVAPDRLSSSGKGQSAPVADNGTVEGRAKNRRVEFVVK